MLSNYTKLFTWFNIHARSDNNKKNNIFYALLPFINGSIFSAPDSLSGINKLIISVLTITIILLYSIINITAYFACLFIIKHTCA